MATAATSRPRVGFVGLGIMGQPMARNALKAGFPVTVTNRTLAKADPLKSAGAAIVKTGADGLGLYIIKEGKVAVIRDGQRVASMGPGEFFGEISVLDGGPRTADVRAESDTVCLTLVSWEVKPLLMENASISYKMLLALVKRLRAQAPSEHH